jgi:hypothetical protein
MLGLILSIIVFNLVAFVKNKHLTLNQIIHIWTFTIAFQMSVDIFIEFKYMGYWYFSKKIDYFGQLAHSLLLPPVNMMFLNWYPFSKKLRSRLLYFMYWEMGLLLYELITLLPEPFGFFHYGWWNIGNSAFLNPILLLVLLNFYKWIYRIENSIRKY